MSLSSLMLRTGGGNQDLVAKHAQDAYAVDAMDGLLRCLERPRSSVRLICRMVSLQGTMTIGSFYVLSDALAQCLKCP